MSELNAPNSCNKKNVKSNLKNNVKLNYNEKNIDNERKRKNENMSNESIAKHFKNNYYSVLDCENDKDCDQNVLKKYEHYVNEKNKKPVSSRNINDKNNHSVSAVNNINAPIENPDNTVVNIEKIKNKKIPPY